ncbi:MAG: 16S rRNA (cytosine(967)-C(5))-methyltransferase RsmB [Planctomycetes bacterium]|nr:16S rRNA (cytosine(967)-C(5))-methyltransferase RsmB [Planctomycetota bacterium]
MNARELALLALRNAHDRGAYVQDCLHELLNAHDLSPADRALATEIASGTVRHRRTLDRLLDRRLRKPIHQMAPAVRLVLESAAYQILFLDRVPDYAVVNEAVRLAREVAHGRVPGLVNAVLRRLSEMVDRDASAEDVQNVRRILPLPHGGTIVLKEGLLPEEPDRRLADAYSFPHPLVKRWMQRWGAARTEDVLAALNHPPRTFARINTLRTSADELARRLPESVRDEVRWISNRVADVSHLPHDLLLGLLDEGLVTIEDSTAMRAVEALDLRPGMTVLDLCAAPGGKASYVAELIRGQGAVWALDRQGPRLDALRETCRRLHLENVHVAANVPAEFPDDMPPRFDRVLVDVPCSNTGVLGRRAEARWRLKDHAMDSLRPLQAELLAQGAGMTAPGGLCVYSTCSIEPDENERLVRGFLADHGEMVLQVERETLPSADGDGGYFARMVRLDDA